MPVLPTLRCPIRSDTDCVPPHACSGDCRSVAAAADYSGFQAQGGAVVLSLATPCSHPPQLCVNLQHAVWRTTHKPPRTPCGACWRRSGVVQKPLPVATAGMRRVAVANLALSPFLFMFLLIYFFMRNAEKFYSHPGSISSRRWSALAKWKLRELNELPHYLWHRWGPGVGAQDPGSRVLVRCCRGLAASASRSRSSSPDTRGTTGPVDFNCPVPGQADDRSLAALVRLDMKGEDLFPTLCPTLSFKNRRHVRCCKTGAYLPTSHSLCGSESLRVIQAGLCPPFRGQAPGPL